jgi:thiol-disulfide isomerase/thioredoxin
MFKKILFSLFLFALLFAPSQSLFAEAPNDVNIYFFWGEGCPHCEKEKPFLEKLAKKYPEVKILSYEVWRNKENQKLLADFGKKLDVNVSGVPFTVVGEKYFTGWQSEETTGQQIEEAVKSALKEENIGPQKVNIPLLGEIEPKNFSLPLLTIVLGALDGFNPCAMWALLFLISLLLGMEDKKRMWILGSAFIVASALVYFIFMSAWLNLILFLGFVFWVRVIIGLVALAGGGYNLKEYFTSPTAVCKVTGTENKQRFFEKLKDVAQQKSFYLALGGIILLAFAVNLVELICSAGLPAVYTQVLVLNNLAGWQYYLYILAYIFFFMLDDLIVFFVAMTTLRITGLTSKYSHLSHLIGGVLMVIIGLLLIFKPAWLMFG